MDPNQTKYLKWGICAVLVGVIAYFVLPIAAKLAWDAVSLMVAGTCLVGGYFFIPAISEWMAQGAWWLKELAWKTNPTVKLRRDLYEFGKEIEEFEQMIAETDGATEQAQATLNSNKKMMDADAVLEWQDGVNEMRAGVRDMISQRDEKKKDYNEMELDIQKAEIDWKMGKSLGKAADALRKAGKMAAGTEGAKVSIEAIQARLANSKASLRTIRSRKPEDWKNLKQRQRAGTIDVQATEVKPVPVLSNSPSPSLSMVKPVVTAKSHAESLIDRL